MSSLGLLVQTLLVIRRKTGVNSSVLQLEADRIRTIRAISISIA